MWKPWPLPAFLGQFLLILLSSPLSRCGRSSSESGCWEISRHRGARCLCSHPGGTQRQRWQHRILNFGGVRGATEDGHFESEGRGWGWGGRMWGEQTLPFAGHRGSPHLRPRGLPVWVAWSLPWVGVPCSRARLQAETVGRREGGGRVAPVDHTDLDACSGVLAAASHLRAGVLGSCPSPPRR